MARIKSTSARPRVSIEAIVVRWRAPLCTESHDGCGAGASCAIRPKYLLMYCPTQDCLLSED